jgi:hypothetical protein
MDQGNIGIPVKNPFTNEVFAAA